MMKYQNFSNFSSLFKIFELYRFDMLGKARKTTIRFLFIKADDFDYSLYCFSDVFFSPL